MSSISSYWKVCDENIYLINQQLQNVDHKQLLKAYTMQEETKFTLTQKNVTMKVIVQTPTMKLQQGLSRVLVYFGQLLMVN